MVEALKWEGEKLLLIDQRKLPLSEEWVEVIDVETCYHAIQDMVVRGAPLIGFTAIWGMVLGLLNKRDLSLEEFISYAEYLKQARPTAVNLEYELNRCVIKAEYYFQIHNSLKGFLVELEMYAHAEMETLYLANLSMAKLALDDLDATVGKSKYRFMTICNTGILACGPMGTALGVISYAHSKGRAAHVYASETRPYLQGARLTAYELKEMGASFEISVEGAASYLMKNGLVDALFVGADRIAANGDTANKIGTSSLAIIAKHYGVPFYVVAPVSSFDLQIESGTSIPIEMRDENEILSYQGVRVAPEGAHAINPSFDVTDHSLITGIICEKGIIKYPMCENMTKLLRG